MDALEPLLQKDVGILKPTDYNYVISFIGAAIEVGHGFVQSIKSIYRIGDDLGRDFEVIVAHNSIPEGRQEEVRQLRKKYHNLVLLEDEIDTLGQGKKTAFEYGTGKFVVPFDTSISYPIRYSDVLHDFLKFKLKRLYYSELALVSREIVAEVGGWRNLASGEDIDLYSRISINYGVFACPTSLLPGDDRKFRELLSIRAFPESQENDPASSHRLLKDLIISCNHSFSDIREMARILQDVEGKASFRQLFFAYIGSRMSKIKPVSYNRNNYVIFMESVLESLVLREFLKMPDVSEEVAWHIDRTHLRFLKIKSKLFQEMEDSTITFIKN